MTTYEHVAKVQALACLIAQPQRFGIELPRRTRIEPLQAVTLPPGIATLDAVVIARRASPWPNCAGSTRHSCRDAWSLRLDAN
jgi:hypothetical protein